MKNKICIITGATSGIGKETAFALAEKEATIILACRNMDKGQKVKEEIQQKTNHDQIEVMLCDLSSLQSIRDFVLKFNESYSSLHLLINNAGLFSMAREETVDGFEMTIGTNHLGPFLLTNLLLEKLIQSAPARVVNVASEMHYRGNIDLEDLQYKKSYSGTKSYADSKLANVLFTHQLAKKLAGTEVTTNSLHPGVVSTNIWPENHWYLKFLFFFVRPFCKTPKQGAQTTIYLATAEEVEKTTGKYFQDSKEKRPSKLSMDEVLQQKLWDMSIELTGLPKT